MSLNSFRSVPWTCSYWFVYGHPVLVMVVCAMCFCPTHSLFSSHLVLSHVGMLDVRHNKKNSSGDPEVCRAHSNACFLVRARCTGECRCIPPLAALDSLACKIVFFFLFSLSTLRRTVSLQTHRLTPAETHSDQHALWLSC